MKRKTEEKHRLDSRLPYHLMSLPAVILSGLVVLIPAVQTIYAAFTKWNGISTVKEWVGLQNFRELANDWIFKQAIVNNVKWTIIFVTVPVIIALFASLHISLHLRQMQSSG